MLVQRVESSIRNPMPSFRLDVQEQPPRTSPDTYCNAGTDSSRVERHEESMNIKSRRESDQP